MVYTLARGRCINSGHCETHKHRSLSVAVCLAAVCQLYIERARLGNINDCGLSHVDVQALIDADRSMTYVPFRQIIMSVEHL